MNRDFAEMLNALSAEALEFLVVGAYAVAGHGIPRATVDIDLWDRPTAENAGRLWRALATFGVPRSRVTAETFTEPDVAYKIGLPPNRIDILTGTRPGRSDESQAEPRAGRPRSKAEAVRQRNQHRIDYLTGNRPDPPGPISNFPKPKVP